MLRRWSRTLGLVLFVTASGCSDKAKQGEQSSSSPLCLTELMYHPVLEDDFDENHEFVEVHNPSDQAIRLGGYRLSGGIRYTFDAEATLEPASYVVVAKNRAALLAVEEYGLDPSQVVGDFEGDLSNGGEEITLEAPDGVVERVIYADSPPWPVAADELGAQEAWLKPELLPLEAHRYRGVSLERVSCAAPAGAPSSWDASPVDGATPARANASALPQPLPVVMVFGITPSAPRSTDAVTLSASFSEGELSAVEVEYFVDELEQTDEATLSVPMAPDGAAYTAQLPTQAAGAIVRYRIVGDRGAGVEPISPRPSDPYAWHAYAVDQGIDTDSRLYQLFIEPDRWTELWDNIESGRVQGCDASATWDGEVPAVFVHDGKVFDVQLRHQGSTFNRTDGPEIDWSAPGPARPSPLVALSWHLRFPRYARFEGQRAIGLNKLTQGCPGITAGVGFELFRRAGLPTPATRFARVQVNGDYYHYMQELGLVNDELLEAWHQQAGGDSVEPLGHLFKSSGVMGDEGPYGWGDGRLLEEACGHSSAARYSYTYERKTHEWLGHEDLIALIEGLHEARAEGDTALRAYLEAHFDVPLMLTYLAVINWLAPWDDMFQNHFLYQRRSNGRWFLLPWDLDLTAGGWENNPPESSLFVGAEGDPDNRDGMWNYFKDSFFRTHRAEYIARLKELDTTVLAPAKVKALVDQVVAAMDQDEAQAAPAGIDCDVESKAQDYREFADQRHVTVLAAE